MFFDLREVLTLLSRTILGEVISQNKFQRDEEDLEANKHHLQHKQEGCENKSRDGN